MSRDLLFKIVVRKLLLTVAMVAMVIAGSLTTDGYCDALSTIRNFQGRAQPSLSSINTVGRISTGVFSTRNFPPRAKLISAMASLDENAVASTVSKDEQDTVQGLVTIEEDGDNRKKAENDPPFDLVAWKAYETSMEEILKQRRVIKNCDKETIAKCRTFLLSYENYLTKVPDIIDIVGNNHDNKREALEGSLSEQSELFQQRFNFTNDECQVISRCLVYMGDACAREQSKQNRNTKNDSDSDCKFDPRLQIVVVWHKIREMGLVMREKSMSSYMYILSSTRGDSGINEESITESDALIDDALLEVVTCYDVIYTPSEKTVTIRLKGLIARGKINEAEEMFATSFDGSDSVTPPSSSSSTKAEETAESDANENIQGRLRTYMPLMEHYCRVGDLKSTLRLYRQMQECTGVHWDLESYTILLSSLARFGYFFGDKQQMSQTDNVDDDSLYGPKLFDSLVSDIANDILELTETTSIELVDAFQMGIENHLQENLIIDDNGEGQLPSSATTSPKTIVVNRVQIPKENGICPVTGVKLRLLALDEIQRQHVHDKLLEMSKKNTEEFLASNIKWQESNKQINPTRKDNIEVMTSKMEESYGYQELRKFSKWLDDREGNLFTTIVDGANVAYYGHSNVHYSSLKKVVEKLESMGERPLVVMPEKYTSKTFFVRPRYYQKLSENDLQVINWLRERDIMYVVPRFVLDDYFWMLASVSNQTNATQRGDLSIPIGDDQGRFPGMRPMLITNDQMRDHKLDLLEPREFRRWCSCHIVNYDIAIYEKDEWEEDRQITLVPADSFSREIQPNMHKRGKGNVWHFPIGDSLDWLCIWIEV